jgi:putative hemolysin
MTQHSLAMFCVGQIINCYTRFVHGGGIEIGQHGGFAQQILLAIIIILLSAYFVGAETALVALRGSRVKQLETKRDRRDRWLLRLAQRPSEWLGAVQLGITIINFIGGAAVIAVIAPVIAPFFDALAQGYGLVISYAITTIVFTYFILIFGELVPKMLAIVYPEEMARICAPSLVFFIWITYPFVWLVSVSTTFFARPVTKGRVQQEDVTAQEIEHMILVHEQIPHFEKKLAARIFKFGDTFAHEVMTPRPDLFALPDTATLADLKRVGRESGHSRIPIYSGDIDHLIGIVMLKDALLDSEANDETQVTCWLRKDLPFVPETLPILLLYRELERSHMHMAIIIDEHGGTAGIATMEDVVEEVFGEIQDEHDAEGVMWHVSGDGAILCSGIAAVRHLNGEFSLNLPEGEGYETIAGLVMDELGIIPKGGEKFEIGDIAIEVTAVKGNRIVKVKLIRIN